ncbi:MAG: hypothetical protein JW744_01435 [Candidatus Diapherotrites archaeon]|uniref:Uncharacterized protein n=1 Tax=Candidatus Iainarchaeum sp. TaxID=3101447 RepID=A0A938YTZ1_9ARCH|nr:hypothetical protein [Candidatus Diapherotrites archaeon]
MPPKPITITQALKNHAPDVLKRCTCEVKLRARVKAVPMALSKKGLIFIKRGPWALYPIRLEKYKGQNVLVCVSSRGVTIVDQKSNKVLAHIPYAAIPAPLKRKAPDVPKLKAVKKAKRAKKKAKKKKVRRKPTRPAVSKPRFPLTRLHYTTTGRETYAEVVRKIEAAEREAAARTGGWP